MNRAFLLFAAAAASLVARRAREHHTWADRC